MAINQADHMKTPLLVISAPFRYSSFLVPNFLPKSGVTAIQHWSPQRQLQSFGAEFDCQTEHIPTLPPHLHPLLNRLSVLFFDILPLNSNKAHHFLASNVAFWLRIWEGSIIIKGPVGLRSGEENGADGVARLKSSFDSVK